MVVDFDLESNVVIEGVPEETESNQNRLNRCISICKTIARKLLSLLSKLKPFLFIIAYSFIGAGVFIALERDNDLQNKAEEGYIRKIARDMLLDKIKMIEKETGPHDFDHRMKEAIIQFEKFAGLEEVPTESDWNFWNAFLFAGTIYTTIGYGNIACSTPAGRTASMIYAIIGIPLALTVLGSLGNTILRLIHQFSDSFGDRVDYCGRKLGLIHSLAPLSFRKRTYSTTTANVSLGVIGGSHSCASVDTPLLSEMEEADKEEEKEPPVLAAIIATISWLFLCAGIFCIWEDWSYFTSFYFFFISLTTIGFGDVTPDYPQFMIMNFALVFIGLALISVCIDLVREKLMKMFMSLLKNLLKEYLMKKAGGEGETNASAGMMQSWGQNQAVKWLMPMLSKEKKAAVMHKFTEEAKEKGIDLPDILTNIDPESGLPSILNVEEEEIQTWLEHQDIERFKKLESNSSYTQTEESLIFRTEKVTNAETQTAITETVETEMEALLDLKCKDCQTDRTGYIDCEVQTEKVVIKFHDLKTLASFLDWPERKHVQIQALPQVETVECQTEVKIMANLQQQTIIIDFSDTSTQTQPSLSNNSCQTQLISMAELEQQTSFDILDCKEISIQTSSETYDFTQQIGQLSDCYRMTQTEIECVSDSVQVKPECSDMDTQTLEKVSMDSAIQTVWLAREAYVQVEPDINLVGCQVEVLTFVKDSQIGCPYFALKDVMNQTEEAPATKADSKVIMDHKTEQSRSTTQADSDFMADRQTDEDRRTTDLKVITDNQTKQPQTTTQTYSKLVLQTTIDHQTGVPKTSTQTDSKILTQSMSDQTIKDRHTEEARTTTQTDSKVLDHQSENRKAIPTILINDQLTRLDSEAPRQQTGPESEKKNVQTIEKVFKQLETQTDLCLLSCSENKLQTETTASTFRDQSIQVEVKTEDKTSRAILETKQDQATILEKSFDQREELDLMNLQETESQTVLTMLSALDEDGQFQLQTRSQLIQAVEDQANKHCQVSCEQKQKAIQSGVSCFDRKQQYVQTTWKAIALDDFGTQVDMRDLENMVSIGIQTGILARIEHIISSTDLLGNPQQPRGRRTPVLSRHSTISDEGSSSAYEDERRRDFLPSSVSHIRDRFERRSMRDPRTEKKKRPLKKIQSEFNVV